jgi:hypothetical protein
MDWGASAGLKRLSPQRHPPPQGPRVASFPDNTKSLQLCTPLLHGDILRANGVHPARCVSYDTDESSAALHAAHQIAPGCSMLHCTQQACMHCKCLCTSILRVLGLMSLYAKPVSCFIHNQVVCRRTRSPSPPRGRAASPSPNRSLSPASRASPHLRFRIVPSVTLTAVLPGLPSWTPLLPPVCVVAPINVAPMAAHRIALASAMLALCMRCAQNVSCVLPCHDGSASDVQACPLHCACTALCSALCCGRSAVGSGSGERLCVH